MGFVIPRMAYRVATEISPRLAVKAAYLLCYKGMRAVWAYKRRLRNNELYPPFMFIALTNKCNLRCHGCWVEKEGVGYYLPEEDLDTIITAGKKRRAHYYTLLGGEPMVYPKLLDVFQKHRDCYFQVITNGMLFNESNVKKLRQLGNVTPLISLDGNQENNDKRRGAGVFAAAETGMKLLQKNKVIFGTACTITGQNMDEVLSDEYINYFVNRGAMYIWYYVYRPMGAEPHTEYCVSREQLIEIRRRLLTLRKKHPIFIIDTYWTAKGEAFCPAATGLGFHVNPHGGVEICPALSFAKDMVKDNGGDLYKTINESRFLRGFQSFVKDRTKGCVILESPTELKNYIEKMGAKDFSARDAYSELAACTPRSSHHLPGEEIPEDYWLYRFLKSQVFFGMGAAG
jgi:MoaA/NifB/PqqE/SkfB family radical SAM enzyme